METISAIFICIVIFIFIMAYYTYKESQEFELWYKEVLKQAPYFGFTEEGVYDFERGVFWQYYSTDLSPEDALRQYLSEN